MVTVSITEAAQRLGVSEKTVCRRLSPNPPKDPDGRREESGRGVRELQGK